MISKKGILPIVPQMPLQDEFPKTKEFIILKIISYIEDFLQRKKSHHIIA